MTPDTLTSEIKEEVIIAARKDFNQLIIKPPVQILDTPEWKNKVKRMVGDNNKHFAHTHK